LGLDDRQGGERAPSEARPELASPLQQMRVRVEHVDGVGLTADGTTEQERQGAMGVGVGGQVVEHDHHVSSPEREVLGHKCPAGHQRVVRAALDPRDGIETAGVRDGGGALAGIITDGDLRRNMDGLLARRAGEVMTAQPKTVAARALAQEAVRAMEDRKITCLFALDDAGALAGIITIHDCLRAGVV